MTNNLFSEFKHHSEEDWETKIISDLKGKTKEEITSRTEDGIEIAPNYFSLEDESSYNFRRKSAWLISTEFGGEIKNQDILSALGGGANSIILHVDDSTNPDELFENIMLDIIDVIIVYHGEKLDAFQHKMTEFLDANYKEHPDLAVVFDPFETTSDQAPHKSVYLNAAHYRNSGATVAQEMALTLSQLTELLVTDPDFVVIQLGIGPNYFEEIAKFRGLRACIEQVAREFGWEGEFRIIGVPCSYYLSTKEVNNNILRVTTMLMASILGGVDQVVSIPFDFKSTPFSNRISRNIQLVLEQESYFDKIDDPASGAYYIETLTNELQQVAWKKFQDMESSGGFLINLNNDSIYQMIDLAHMERLQKYAANKRVMIGVNRYKNPDADETKISPQMWNGIETRNLSALLSKEAIA